MARERWMARTDEPMLHIIEKQRLRLSFLAASDNP
jgi:hypothetical protein